MNINKNNYEAFFLDYHEGNLTPQEVADLLLFVEQHPELKEELESFENVTIEDYSKITFENKSDLKKEITDNNREEYFIKAVENTLNAAEKTLLENYLKQYPQYIIDYNLFQKTKVQADTSIVFEKKDAMKKDLTPSFSTGNGNAGEALIALMEGLLSEEEVIKLNKQIAADASLQKELALLQKTKLQADASIVFKNKADLKRKERKIIPLYFYYATAAAVLLLVGLYFLNNTNSGGQFADKKVSVVPNQIAVNKNAEAIDKTNVSQTTNVTADKISVAKTNKQIAKNNTFKKQTDAQVSPVNNSPIIKNEEQPLVAENNIPQTVTENKEEVKVNAEIIAKNNEPAINKQQPAANSEDIYTLKEIAVAKLKESTLDKKTLEEEKKSGRLNKLNGWDLAKVAAKGINKLMGSNVKVEPKYNDKGDVTAYAFAAGGFEISRGR